MTDTTQFEIRGLTLKRNNQTVLKDINMHIKPGEIVCLLGPSGSGKSSLLRCLNRLTEPPTGAVFMENQDITTLNILDLRRRVGMVFQQVALFEGNVSENIRYGPSLQNQNLDANEMKRLIKLADLPVELLDRNSQELSGGQGQRVALARALATQPQVLLLDEPTSSLDPSATRNIEETVQKLRQTIGLTILWVTHDPDQAKRVADRLYLLVDGSVQDEGMPDHVLKEGSNHLTALFAAGELEGTT